MAKQRLQKVLAAAGVGSRRKCEELILGGAVEVNGKAVNKLPAFADPQEDTITVNGKKIRQEKSNRFYPQPRTHLLRRQTRRRYDRYNNSYK